MSQETYKQQLYVFRNQWDTFLHAGDYVYERLAWDAFWSQLKYPEHAKDVKKCQEQGIYFITYAKPDD